MTAFHVFPDSSSTQSFLEEKSSSHFKSEGVRVKLGTTG